MENILFIQSEKFGKPDYLFLNNHLITDLDNAKKIFSNSNLFIGKYDIPLKKSKNPFFETLKKIPSGFLIKGQLNQQDQGGRTMNFTCYYSGHQKEFKNYLNSCLEQIGKSYNVRSINEIEKTLITYNLAVKLILGAVIVGIGFAILKSF